MTRRERSLQCGQWSQGEWISGLLNQVWRPTPSIQEEGLPLPLILPSSGLSGPFASPGQEVGTEQGWSGHFTTLIPRDRGYPDSRRVLQALAWPLPGLELRGCSVLK